MERERGAALGGVVTQAVAATEGLWAETTD